MTRFSAAMCLAFTLLTGVAVAKVSVEITGVSADLRRQISATLEIATAKENLTARDVENLHRRAPEQILQSLKPLGFYRATVEGQLTQAGADWQASYVVQAGEPLRVTRTDLALEGPGRDDSNLVRLISRFPLRMGDTLRHDRYEAGKKAIADQAAERGYLDAGFDSSLIRVDLESYTSDIVLHFRTGPRYLYGPVILHQDIIDTLLLVGRIPFHEGDTLELSGLRRLQTNLSEVTYFSQAQVELRREDADGLKIPIDVQLWPRKTQKYEFGIGYGTDTGVRGRIEAGFRRLNRRGHNATLRLDVSELERLASIEYRIPPAFPRTILWTFGVGAGDFSPDWSSTRALRFSVTPSRTIAGWRAALGLSLDFEAFEISVQQDTSRLLVLSTQWERTRADDLRLPSHGTLVRFGLKGSHESVLSTATFMEATTELKGIVTLLPGVRVLSHGQAGWVATHTFEKMPPSLRYVTGGAQTVRGYDFETLSPVDQYGAIVGGKVLVIGSLELDYLFIKGMGRWGLAVFADAGNAASSANSFRFETGAGGGVRWASPVGMLRLDLAWPLSQPDLGYRLHFSMGPDL